MVTVGYSICIVFILFIPCYNFIIYVCYNFIIFHRYYWWKYLSNWKQCHKDLKKTFLLIYKIFIRHLKICISISFGVQSDLSMSLLTYLRFRSISLSATNECRPMNCMIIDLIKVEENNMKDWRAWYIRDLRDERCYDKRRT